MKYRCDYVLFAKNEGNICAMKQDDKLSGLERRERILEYLKREKKASPQVLSELFSVSEMTIRRDFHLFEEQGLVVVHYGGAHLLEEKQTFPSFSNRYNQLYQNKLSIAKRSATTVKEGDILFMDASTTVAPMTQFIQDVNLTVITNSLPVVESLCGNPNIRLFIAPGTYSEQIAGTLDYSTVEYIRNFHVDKAFIGAIACNPNFGVSCTGEIEGAVKRMMWENAEQSFLLVDHTKFDKKSLLKHNELWDYSYIMTDMELDEEKKEQILQRNKNLILCR